MFTKLQRSKPTRYCFIWDFPFELSLKVFKTRLLGRGFHTLIKGILSPPQPMWDLTIHPPLGSSVLAGTCSLLQSMWDSPIYSPSGPNVLIGTPPCVHPLLGSASSLAHRPVFGSDTICNGPSPPLADFVLFGLSFRASSQGF